MNDDTTMNNAFILDTLQNRSTNYATVLSIIREKCPAASSLTDDEVLNIAKVADSAFQRKRCTNGNHFQEIVTAFLVKHNLQVLDQVTIDKRGIILGLSMTKKGTHTIDHVVVGKGPPPDIKDFIGKSIEDFGVISSKTTIRSDRWKDVFYNETFPSPKKYLLVMADTRMPRCFRENETRKIVSCHPLKMDTRVFKLNFDDLVAELV
jgi:hypothetical protein